MHLQKAFIINTLFVDTCYRVKLSLNQFFAILGEQLSIELTGSSKNGNIWIDPNKIQLDDTFMGLKRQQNVVLYNNSSSVIKFSWQKFESKQQDMDELNKYVFK